jgi:two-component system chemotaxis response regulator CheY
MFDPAIKILVVDDMSTMRKIVRKNLTMLGYTNIIEAEDGLKAWAVLTENPDIHMIVSDWNMPNCTGLELLKRVRADKRFASCVFVMVTAEGDAGQVKDALVAGVDNYVLKPFTPDSFREKLEQTYKKRSA